MRPRKIFSSGPIGKRGSIFIALTVPVLLYLFLFFTSTASVLPEAGIYNGKRLLQVGLLPVIFLIALASTNLRHATGRVIDRIPTPISISLIAVLLLGLISTLRLEHPDYAYVELVILFCLIAASFVVAGTRSIANKSFDRTSLSLIAAVGVAVLLQEVMGFLANWAMGEEFSYEKMFIYFAHQRFFNQFQTWTLPLIAAIPVVFNKTLRTTSLAVLLIAGQWYLMIASGARGSIVSVAFAILLVGFLAYPVGKNWLKLHIAGATAGLALYAAVLNLQKLLASGEGQFVAQSVGRELADTTGRTWIWDYAWQDALRHPWLGIGPARFACESSAPLPAHPHNIVLQLLAEWGFPVTIIVAILVAYLLFTLVKQIRINRNSGHAGNAVLMASLAASVVSAAVHSSVSGMTVMPVSQVTAVLIGGWAISVCLGKERLQRASGSFPKLVLAAFISSAILLGFSLQEIDKMEFRLANFSEKELRMPRFWQEGRACKYDYGNPK